MNDNFFIQHVDTPTRARGSDDPHILDLVITNDDFIEKIDYNAPLGKSDHSVLDILFKDESAESNVIDKFNFQKGDYEEFRKYANLEWDKILGSCDGDVEKMWSIFVGVIKNGMEQFIPKIRSFNSRNKKHARPLSKEIRKLICKKHRLWKKYLRTKSSMDYDIYKRVRNKVKSEISINDRTEQINIAESVKTNHKKFWSFINGKIKSRSKIPDLIYEDTSGRTLVAESEEEKVLLLTTISAKYLIMRK